MVEVYKATNTTYTKHGDMVLMPISAIVTAEINGAWTLTLTHPLDDEGRWKYLETGNVIKVTSFNGQQLFRIVKTEKQSNGVSVVADPIFLDARGDCFIYDIRPTNATGNNAIQAICSGKYRGTSDISKQGTAYFINRNLIEAICGEQEPTFLGTWGGEIEWDNYEVKINTEMGSDNGVQVLYGKNITGISETISEEDVVTRIVPQAFNGRMLSGATKYVDSPLINNYPTIHTLHQVYENIKLKQDVTGEEPQEGDIICDTVAELELALRDAATADFNAGIDKPFVSLEISMALLQNTEEYKDFAVLETVSLGDTVHCRHARLDITSDARVVALTWNCLTECVSEVTLSSIKKSFFTSVASVVRRVDQSITPNGEIIGEKIKGFINGAWTQLRIQQDVARREDARAILFEDLDSTSATFGALAIGTQGLQISQERTPDGTDWVWTTAITAEGVIADTLIAQERLIVAKHFFVGADGYVHITEDEYDYTIGNNILIDGTSVNVRQGTTTLASFGATIRVGKPEAERVEVTGNSIDFYDGNNELAGKIKTGVEATYTTTDSVNGISLPTGSPYRHENPVDYEMRLTEEPLISATNPITVSINYVDSVYGPETATATITQANRWAFAPGDRQFEVAWADNWYDEGTGITDDHVILVYNDGTDILEPVSIFVTYDFESSGATFSFGKNNVVNGGYGLASGENNSVEGVRSQALGYGLKADGNNQLVAGSYNQPVDDALFILGNGVNDSNRSNALVVDKEGMVTSPNIAQKRVFNLNAGRFLNIKLKPRQSIIVMCSGGSAAQHRGIWIVMAPYAAGNPYYLELKACGSVNVAPFTNGFQIENVSTAKRITILGGEEIDYEITI